MRQLHSRDTKNWVGTKNFFKQKTQKYKDSILVAEEKGKITGFIEGGFYAPKPHSMVEIYSLFATKSYRNKGVEESLLKKFILAHKRKGFKTIWATDFSYLATEFYEKLGFKKTVSWEIPFPLKLKKYSKKLMRLTL